jgi:ribosomal subunit interface protein
MKIDIKATNLKLTTPLYNYIVEKIGALKRFTKKWETEGVVETWVEVARTTKHHHKGPVFYVDIDLRLPGKILRGSQYNWDIRTAIDKVRDELKKEIKKYKETPQAQNSKKTMREIRKLRGK